MRLYEVVNLATGEKVIVAALSKKEAIGKVASGAYSASVLPKDKLIELVGDKVLK